MSFDKNIAIKIDSLSKCFFTYKEPIDRLKQFIIPKLGFSKEKKYYQEFWAVNNISLEINKGETVAIIGRNGSGKSTLLQMICGTLNQTTGSVSTFGKVAALLELGSGFNPEFTGKENVYLNASVYGLTNKEIDEKYEAIIRFADIGDFIDQPVKTYSSGMYVRLAFAVIAHVDADILVIDEALAVGDAVFTQKCMRFIREFQKKGTLLFVSHDMSSVQNLCEKALWINKGNSVDFGCSKDIAEKYLKYTMQEIYGDKEELIELNTKETAQNSIVDYRSELVFSDNLSESTGWKTGKAEIVDVRITNLTTKSEIFKGGEKVRLSIKAKTNIDLEQPILGFLVKDKLGQYLFGENTLPIRELSNNKYSKGDKFEANFDFKLPMLPNGDYSVMCSVADGDLHNNIQHHHLNDAVFIKVSNSKVRWGLVGVEFNNIEFK
ncbi:ABC transporter ATP-binding protein [Photobacterium damselae]|uniref:ABC transporter ATP-binding protein n=1 Tax=Photobacterium damselae TaxID=38293 RepID=A0ABD6WY37_PHODM|nr:ABC transporter ATP-binding protein [Photobacterium damselae]OBU42446.1 ABC transporter ATP-binding protein [Photobacterium damselae]PSU14138.1 ABC transporter ATP-binding protein [Photobacterium damselae]